MCPAKTTKIGAGTAAGGVQEGVEPKRASRPATRMDQVMGVVGPTLTSRPYPYFTREVVGNLVPSITDLYLRDVIIEYKAQVEFIEIAPSITELALFGPIYTSESLEASPSITELRLFDPYKDKESVLEVSPSITELEFSITHMQPPTDFMTVEPSITELTLI